MPDGDPARAPGPLRRRRQARALPGPQGGVLPRRLRARRAPCSTSSACAADAPLAVVRTPPAVSLYHRFENPLFGAVLERLRDQGQVVVLPRTDEQRAELRRAGGYVVPERAIDAQSLIAFADLVVSAGGHDEPRGGRARHPGLDDVRGAPRRGRRGAHRRGPPARGSSAPRTSCSSAATAGPAAERVRRDPRAARRPALRAAAPLSPRTRPLRPPARARRAAGLAHAARCRPARAASPADLCAVRPLGARSLARRPSGADGRAMPSSLAVARVRRTGDRSLRERLVLTYAPLAKQVAYRKLREAPTIVEVDDLISAGLEALHARDRALRPAPGGDARAVRLDADPRRRARRAAPPGLGAALGAPLAARHRARGRGVRRDPSAGRPTERRGGRRRWASSVDELDRRRGELAAAASAR